MQPVVRRVDHVMVPADDPAPLFELFTSTLGLPGSWPVAEFGPVRTGGVCLGNANLEFMSASSDDAPFLQSSVPLSVRGIALEPVDFDTCVDALDRLGVEHSHDYPFTADHPQWTNVFLLGLLGHAHATAFLCHYHEEIGVRGPAAEQALADAGGGAIGLRALEEVTIGMADPSAGRERWERLLGPPDEPGMWRPGGGAALRIKEAPMDSIQGLVFTVASIAKATQALMDRDMLGPVRKRGVGLDHSKTHGLDVWLTEEPGNATGSAASRRRSRQHVS